MNTTETQRALESFGHRVIKDARDNLSKLGKNASNELYVRSLDGVTVEYSFILLRDA